MRWLKLLGGVMAGLYVAWAIVATALHPQLIYPFGPHDMQRSGYELTVVDGAHLYHWQGESDAATVLFFMGNGGALTYFQQALAVHEDAGRSVVAVQYPGGGGVPGDPSEAVLKAQALVAYDWLAARGDGAVVVHGYSMGTSLAQFVASEREVDAVLLDAPFVRMCEVMRRNSMLPACLMPFVQKWDSTAYADAITAPVLIQHGAEDRLIPPTDGQRLAQVLEAQGVDVSLALQPGVGHNTLMQAADYSPTIEGFLTASISSP